MNGTDQRSILSSFWSAVVAAVGNNPAFFTAEPLFRAAPKATGPLPAVFYDRGARMKPSGGRPHHRRWKRRRAAGWDRRA